MVANLSSYINPSKFMSIAGAAAGIGMEYSNYRKSLSEGKSPTAAGLDFAINATAFTVMGPLPAIAVTQGYGLVKAGTMAGYAYHQRMQSWFREVRMPFSQSFEHSDVTSQLQQRGLQAISGQRSLLGSEASMMAARYGRR